MAEVLAVSPSAAEVKLTMSSPKSAPAPVPQENIFRSPLPDIEIPDNKTLTEYIFQNASLYPDKICLVDHQTSKEYTYAEVQTLCKKIAVGLSNVGIAQGDVVMLLLPNCAEFALLLLGIATRGAAATTANTFNKPPEVDKQVKAAKARVIATQAALVPKLVNEIDPSVRFLTIDDRLEGHLHMSDILQANENEFVAPEILPTDVVALPFSSGTTGLPKGVMLTHQSLITDIAQHVDGENPNFYLTSDDVVLCVLPLIHIFSASVLFASLRAGCAIVIMQKFDVVAFLQVIEKFRISVMALVPPIVLGVTRCPIVDEFDLSSVRTVLSGAAPMGKVLEDKLRSKMPNAVIGQGYGMTEAGPVITMCPSFAKIPIPVKPGSCGTVVRNAELKVVDLETGASLLRNQSGEICIRGKQIMKGYLNNPEGTALTIDKDGWLHSGDVGYVDDDDQIFLVDRVKEIIKYKGYQVPPAELESLLIAHPSIQDAAVVPELDEAAGELPVAFVVRAKGSDITEKEIKDYVSPKVVFYKRICKVYFVDVIPKSPTGKILRKDLKNRLAEEAMLRKTD